VAHAVHKERRGRRSAWWVCWVADSALAAAIIATPVAMALHSITLHAVAHAAATGIPASFGHVLTPVDLGLLALSGRSSR